MTDQQNPLEHTYGMRLQTAIITLLLELKEESPGTEVNSTILYHKLKERIPGLKEQLINKRQNRLFRVRIGKVLNTLSKNNQLVKMQKKTAIDTRYYSFKINM